MPLWVGASIPLHTEEQLHAAMHLAGRAGTQGMEIALRRDRTTAARPYSACPSGTARTAYPSATNAQRLPLWRKGGFRGQVPADRGGHHRSHQQPNRHHRTRRRHPLARRLRPAAPRRGRLSIHRPRHPRQEGVEATLTFVKPCVKSNNDAADAEAICEAVSRPSMRFVPIKNVPVRWPASGRKKPPARSIPVKTLQILLK